MNDTNNILSILSLLNGLVIIICSIIYLYFNFQLKPKTILTRVIIITAVLSGTLAIEAKSILTTHLSYETSLLGALLFGITASASLTRTEILPIFGKSENLFKTILLVFSVLLFGLGCWIMYLELF